MSREVVGMGLGIIIRLLLRNLRKKRQHLEEKAPPQLTKEEIDQYIVDTTIDEAYEQLLAEYDRAYRELLQREKEVEDPYIRKLIQKIKRRHELFRPDNTMRPPWMLTAILLNEALKHGIKDRDKIYQYILKASWEYAKQIAQILPAKKYKGKHIQAYAEQARNPYVFLDEVATMINEANEKDPTWKKYWDDLDIVYEKMRERLAKNLDPGKEHHKIGKYVQLLEEAILEAEKEAGIEPFWHKTPEEILGIKPEEEEEKEETRIAADMIKEALLGRMPSISSRIAILADLIQKGKLNPETVLNYIEILHSPNTPQGTALYNLIHKLISHYEEQVATDKTPDPPSKALQKILLKSGIPAWKDPKEVLREAAERRSLGTWIPAKALLGIPLPPSKAAKATLQLIEKLEKLERGEANPEELDTILELATLAKTIPTEPHPEGPNNLKERTLNPKLWNEITQTLLQTFHEEAVRLGREKESKLIKEMTKIVEQELRNTDKTQPYYKIIAKIMQTVTRKLQEKGHPWKDAQWAANLAQNILLTLPLHAMEKGEEPRLKALLTEGYNHQEHETTLLLLGLYNFHKQLLNAKTKEEKEALLARIRDSMNTLETLKGSVYRTLLGFREKETKEKLQKMTPEEKARFMAKTIHETIKHISRVIR